MPAWLRELLGHTQPLLLRVEAQIRALTVQLQNAATPGQPRGLGALSSVVIDREIGNWARFRNRRQVGSYTGLCPGEYSSGKTRVQGCVTKHGNPRLRAALVETAWRLVRFQPEYRPVVKWRRTLAKGALATGAARKTGDRGRGPAARGRSLAHPHRAGPGGRPRLDLKSMRDMSSRGTERNHA